MTLIIPLRKMNVTHLAIYRCKMAFFKRAWQKVKVLSCTWALGFKSEMIRPLKWGTLHSRTPSGSKNTSHQSWKKKKKIWWLVFLKPMGVQRRHVPHFKGLICAKVDLEAQGRDSTFTFCHAHLKKAILHHKRASGRFILSSTVQCQK